MLFLGMVHITDRSGEPVDEIPLATKERILNLEWSPDGEVRKNLKRTIILRLIFNYS